MTGPGVRRMASTAGPWLLDTVIDPVYFLFSHRAAFFIQGQRHVVVLLQNNSE